jgi:hypothetical protein
MCRWVEDADDLYMVAAFAEDGQMSALGAAAKAGAEIVAGLTQGSVDREPFEPRHQCVGVGRRLGLARPRVSGVDKYPPDRLPTMGNGTGIIGPYPVPGLDRGPQAGSNSRTRNQTHNRSYKAFN